MTTFIFDVLNDLKNKQADFSKLTFVLPSKRAGIFLKHQLTKILTQTIFSPTIISIEEFVEELSNLKALSNIELLFNFYKTYIDYTERDEQEPFDSFSKWAQILLQDFNEIDRYLIPQKEIFNYLGAIQEINHWSLEKEPTTLVKNYLTFWNKLEDYYNALTEKITQKGIAYQGLVYREAVDSLEFYLQKNEDKKHYFIGFIMIKIFKEMLDKQKITCITNTILQFSIN